MATVYSFRQPANAGHRPARHPDHLAPSYTFNLKLELQIAKIESDLVRFEAIAREKYLAAIEGLPNPEMEGWFIRQLNSQILPTLTRIGFDESFARLLFQTAAPDWQRMGPYSNKGIRLRPNLIRDIKSVRIEILSNTASGSDSSWITLPRVYHFLKEKHADYLLCYLDCLAAESESEFRRILTRVIIEFVGNYALKFRNSILPRCLIDTALFYGYETMFWKNLRQPPLGFADDLIFNHYLRWIKFFPSKCAEISEDMSRSVGEMEIWHQKIMLAVDSFQPTDENCPGLGRLLFALRHGRPGTEAAIEYMGRWFLSSRPDAADPLISALFPAALNKLFQTIKMRLPVESAEVRKSLGNFLRGLQENIASNAINKPLGSGCQTEKFRFVIRRVLGDIDRMTASLA